MTKLEIEDDDPATGVPWDADELRQEALHLMTGGFSLVAVRILALARALDAAA